MTVAKFDPSLFNRIRTITDPVAGEISYGVLTVRELMVFDKMPDEVEKTVGMVTLMLSKADPSVTEEMVQGMDYDAVLYLCKILMESSDFRASVQGSSSRPTMP
jgi:hypothetical protein